MEGRAAKVCRARKDGVEARFAAGAVVATYSMRGSFATRGGRLGQKALLLPSRIDCEFCRRSFSRSGKRHDRIIDLRSDTVTAPSQAMLQAALTAKTGDDVMGEDPTVKELEAVTANLLGKEAGLFVPTGTMANLVAIMAHCHTRASEIIIGANSHICLWEAGNYASLGGVSSRQLQEDSHTAQLKESDIMDAYRNDNDDHYAQTRLLCLENTHNMMGGVALSKDYIDRVGALCKGLGIGLHVDGARLFNAAEASNTPIGELCDTADSVSICLSKGLGCPLGSVLVGDTETIRLARRARKRCGGGMRQAGVMAAMGLYALQNNVARLGDDRSRAMHLADKLKQHGFRLARSVETNMVFFSLPENSRISRAEFAEQLAAEHGVKLFGGYSRNGEFFRAVTHLDISDADIERAGEAMIEVCRPLH